MTFLAPQFLTLLALAPVIGAVMLLALWMRRRAVQRFYGASTGRNWAPLPSIPRGLAAATCWALAIAGVSLALARPAHSPVPRKVERSGRDVVFVVDVSRSMLAQDLKPSRLERAKLMVSDVLDSAEGDRVGLVAFAGTAVVRCPMTTDYSFARMSLDAISPESVGRGGTAIGDAIRVALALVQAGQTPGDPLAADLYLLTDGEDHETRPLEAAQDAAAAGVRIVAIGLGSDTGAPVPADPEAASSGGRPIPRDGYMQYGGERVQSRMNAAALRGIAEATPGGVFLDVGTGNLELDRVYRLLRRAGDQKQLEATESMRYTEVFQFPLAAAIVLGMAAMILDGVRIAIRRRPSIAPVAAAAVFAAMALVPSARAQSVEDDLGAASALLAQGKHGEALSLLEGASVRHPDSASVLLARGCAQFGLQQNAEAEATFRRAEQLAMGREGATVARARYNLGLIDAGRGAAQAKEDPEAALRTLEQAERWFRNARPGLNGADRDAAAANIESIQIAREALRKQIAERKAQQQQQQQQQSQSQSGQKGQGQGQGGDGEQQSQPKQGDQQNQQQEPPPPERKAAEDLAKLAQEQEQAADESKKSQQQQGRTPEQQRQQADQMAEEQRRLSEETGKLDQELARQQAQAKAQEQQQQAEQKGRQSEDLGRARERLDEARQAQARAEEQLRQGNTSGAEQSQREAAERLRDAARSALGIDQQPGEPQPEEQQQATGEKPEENPRAFNATAASILDREARQREANRRLMRAQQRTRTPPVEKDW